METREPVSQFAAANEINSRERERKRESESNESNGTSDTSDRETHDWGKAFTSGNGG